jgi:hypothetical protein
VTDSDVRDGLAGAEQPPDGVAIYRERKRTCPVVCLGQLVGTYYFLSPSGELRSIEAREFTERGLSSIVDGNLAWYEQHFPRRNSEGVTIGFRTLKVGAWLQKECAHAGIWDPNTPVRGLGVWRSDDSIVVHCGDRLFVDGKPERAGAFVGGAIYPARAAIAHPAKKPAPAAAGRSLREALNLWNFRDPAGGDLLLGFIGQAMLGGAADWRAHVYVLAQLGAGKTWLARLIKAALGPIAHTSTNNFTEAGLRQMMTSEARAMILDEAESEEGASRIAAVIELIRHASGLEGARILRGTKEGRTQIYTVTGAALLLSILPAPMKPADRSRITRIALGPLATGGEAAGGRDRAAAAIAAAHDAAPALWARAIAGWERFRATFDAYRTALMDLDKAVREAEQLATLLAGRDLLIADAVPGAAQIARSVDLVRGYLSEADAASDGGEGEECLRLLYGSPGGVVEHGRMITVAELILDARRSDAPAGTLRALEALGLRLVMGDRVDGSLDRLFVANQAEGLARIFEGTRWHKGGWVTALREYIVGALVPKDPMRINGFNVRGTVIPASVLPWRERAA